MASSCRGKNCLALNPFYMVVVRLRNKEYKIVPDYCHILEIYFGKSVWVMYSTDMGASTLTSWEAQVSISHLSDDSTYFIGWPRGSGELACVRVQLWLFLNPTSQHIHFRNIVPDTSSCPGF